MKKILYILAFLPLTVFSQFFVNVDTNSHWKPQPPLPVEIFSINTADPGDTSALAVGAVAYWSLEEAAGGTAFDSVDSYDGTLMNTPTLAETGINSNCMLFELDNSEWIDIGADAFWDVGDNDLTVRLWFKIPTGATGNGGLIGNYGTAPYWYIRATPGSTIKGVVNFSGSNIETQTYAATSYDVWHHLVYLLDRDGNAELYLDNVLQADQDDISAYSAVNLSNTNTMAIGRIGNAVAGYYHDGWIDEVYVDSLLWTPGLIAEDYNSGIGKFWPFGGAGGDSLRMITSIYDTRADTFRVQAKLSGNPTDEDDGTNLFAYGISDTANYNDTTFVHSLTPRDTIWYVMHASGLYPEDIWDYTYDTVRIDSSGIIPVEDAGIWDSIWALDFEEYTPPHDYIESERNSDWFNQATYWTRDHCWPDCWCNLYGDEINDSIIYESKSESNVLKYPFVPDSYCGYDADGWAHRGGEGALVTLPQSYQEIYFSYNLMFKPGWLPSGGGKLPGLGGGDTHENLACPPGEGDGWKFDMMWMWPSSYYYNGGYYNWYMSTGWYAKYQGMPGCPNSQWFPFRSFHPSGTGLQYHHEPDDSYYFYFDVSDSIWYNITMRFVMNTFTGSTANADGIVEGFINGKLIAQFSGIKFMSYTDYTDPDSWYHGINTIWWKHFWGGGGAPLRDEWSLFDDIWLWLYDDSVEDVPRGNELSQPGRIINVPGDHKWNY